MRVSIYTGNHFSHNGLSDMVLFVKRALVDAGHDARIDTEIVPGRLNVLIEHFPDDASLEPVRRGHALGARYVMIATEPMADGTFNGDIAPGHRHYGNRDYWRGRHDGFLKAAAHVEAVWVLAESMLQPYRAALPGMRVLFLPHGWVSGPPRFEHLPEQDKDIDVYSSGTVTEHRMAVIQSLRGRGVRVVWDPLGVSDYTRLEHLSRARVCLSLKLSPETRITSVSRLQFGLQHGCYLLHERCAEPSPLDPYVFHLATSEIADWCEAALQVTNRREVAEGLRARFRDELPMRRLLPPILAASLGQSPGDARAA